MGQTFNYDELKKNVPLINKVINEKIVKLKSDNVEQITPNSFFEQIISEIIFRVFFGDDIKNMSFDGVPAIQYVLKIIYE